MAAARLQGTKPSLRRLLELLLPGIANALRRGTRATAASGYEAPDRSDEESSYNGSKIRLGREQRGAALQGKDLRGVAAARL